jgi:hypothetical protein
MFTKNRILFGLLIVFIIVFVVLIYYVQNQPISKEGFTDAELDEISQAKFYTSSKNKLPTSLLDMVRQSDFNNSSMKDISSTLDSSVNYLNNIPEVAFELTAPRTKIPTYSSSLDKTMNILYTNKLPNSANIYIPTPLPTNNHVQSHRDNTTTTNSGLRYVPVPNYQANSPDVNDNIWSDYEAGILKADVKVPMVSTPTISTQPITVVSGNVTTTYDMTYANTYIKGNGYSYADYLSKRYGIYTGDFDNNYSTTNSSYTFTGNTVTGNTSSQSYDYYSEYEKENVITPYMGCISSGKTEAECSIFATYY